MTNAGVIGWPIHHSRSPLIHRYWLSHHGISGSYEKFAVEPKDAEKFLQSLDKNNLAGCNVTVPLKEIAFEAAEIKDQSAVAVGAANTIWRDDMGRLCAANTDTEGFMAHLEATVPDWRRASDRPVVILGAGGAARAIIYGFLNAGNKDIEVCNRTLERSQNLADSFGPSVAAISWDKRAHAANDSSIIVNTTTIGMNGEGNLGIEFDSAHADCIVCDIVYVPLETQFLAKARAKGLRTVDGLGMLLHQAAPGFEKWFGIRPSVTQELRDVVIKDLNKS